MAKRISEAAYTNPEVRFEREDVETSGVVYFAIALATSTLIVVLTMLWYGKVLLDLYRKPDPLKLPQASVDRDRRPPEPRLEALEDLDNARKGKTEGSVRVAEIYYKAQRDLLKDGNTDKGVLSIERTIEQMKLPSREGKGAPSRFSREMPAKASSGEMPAETP